MSGVKRLKIAEIDPTLKGEAYKKAMYAALSPESLANCEPTEGNYSEK